MALGIGALLAIFQLVDAVGLRPLPVEAAHEFVEVTIEGGRGPMMPEPTHLRERRLHALGGLEAPGPRRPAVIAI